MRLSSATTSLASYHRSPATSVPSCPQRAMPSFQLLFQDTYQPRGSALEEILRPAVSSMHQLRRDAMDRALDPALQASDGLLSLASHNPQGWTTTRSPGYFGAQPQMLDNPRPLRRCGVGPADPYSGVNWLTESDFLREEHEVSPSRGSSSPLRKKSKSTAPHLRSSNNSNTSTVQRGRALTLVGSDSSGQPILHHSSIKNAPVAVAQVKMEEDNWVAVSAAAFPPATGLTDGSSSTITSADGNEVLVISDSDHDNDQGAVECIDLATCTDPPKGRSSAPPHYKGSRDTRALSVDPPVKKVHNLEDYRCDGKIPSYHDPKGTYSTLKRHTTFYLQCPCKLRSCHLQHLLSSATDESQ